MTPRRLRRLIVPLLVVAATTGFSYGFAATPASGAVSHQQIDGTGSSWSGNALDAWDAAVAANGLQVSFTAIGSAQGRKDFGNFSNDFAISDIGYQGKDPQTGDTDLPCKLGAANQCRAYAYLPIVSGGTAFPYHVEVGGKLVRNLRLSGETLAKIFTGVITDWSDKQITADNHGKALPALPIIPVYHAEGSGSSAQFTTYLDSMYPSIWRAYTGGVAGETEYFLPKSGSNGIAQTGSDQVMNYIAAKSGNGTIGYDEYSYALGQDFPVVKLQNAAGYFTLPTQYNVAVSLTQAQINQDSSSPDYLLQNLDKVYRYTDKRTYPLSSYSYMIIPTSATDDRMNTAKRQTLADYIYYDICQGQASIGSIGYSALPLYLVKASFQQSAKLKAADPNVDLSQRDVTTCNNPTFVPGGNPTDNHLKDIAPMPPACDSVTSDPCLGAGDSGTLAIPDPKKQSNSQSGSTAAASSGTGGGPRGSGGAGTASGSAGPAARAGGAGQARNGSTAGTVNPDTGQVDTTLDMSSGGADIAATPTELAAYRQQNMTSLLAPIAAVEMLLVLVAPPVAYALLRRRRKKA